MQRNVKRSERGVTAIVVGLLAPVLIAGVGLSADVGNVMWQRHRMQGAVDNAALAIAEDCALRRASCSTSGTNPALSTADLIVSQNIDGATTTVPGTIASTSPSVTVRAKKHVPMSFAGMIGLVSKETSVKATATWEQAPKTGYPLLPMAVGYCQWKANAYPATDHIQIRTDLLDSGLKSLIATLNLLGIPLTNYFAEQTCTNGQGQTLKMSDGAVWLTALVDALDLFDVSNMSLCNMKVTIFETMLVTAVTPVIAPTACVNKLKVGTIAMMPVYESSSPLTVLSSSITMRIVGFAPFKITGWREPGNAKVDASAPSCINILTLTCQGIQGYFVRSVVQDPDQVFAYDSSAPDLGGVRLTPKLTQ